jgi:putative endonuclease
MAHSRSRLGQRGEALAAAHLQSKGYRIIETNARTPSGEIDIVANDGGTLVVVEVRTRRGDRFGTAAESVNAGKRAKLRQVTAEYVMSHPGWAGDYRIDVVVVEMAADGSLVNIEALTSAVGEE